MMLIPMVISTGLAAYIARALVETRSWRWIYYIYIVLVGKSKHKNPQHITAITLHGYQDCE